MLAEAGRRGGGSRRQRRGGSRASRRPRGPSRRARGRTLGSSFSVRETVLRLTPATAATSRIVGRRRSRRDSEPLVSGNVSLIPAASWLYHETQTSRVFASMNKEFLDTYPRPVRSRRRENVFSDRMIRLRRGSEREHVREEDEAEVLAVAGRRDRADRRRRRRRRGPRIGRLVGVAAAAAPAAPTAARRSTSSSRRRTRRSGSRCSPGREGGRGLRPQGRPLRPDVGDRRQPSRFSSSRTRSRAAPTRSCSRRTPRTRSTTSIKRARKAGMKVILADTAVTTPADGFIGTDNVKAGRAGGRAHVPARQAAGQRHPATCMIESSVAGIQTLKDRDAGFRGGLAAPARRSRSPRRAYNNNDLNTAASQVNDALTANPNLVGIFADNNTSGTGAARAIKDNKAADRIPVVAFDTDPQENAALADGSIDALVVQNPYFFGYQGVVEAGMAAVGTLPPLNLDPGAVVADKANMDVAARQAAPQPADREGAGLMGATTTEREPEARPRPRSSRCATPPRRTARSRRSHGVTFELRAGEVMCLAGENGAGKSTLIKILTGAIRRDERRVPDRRRGHRRPRRRPRPATAGIGVVYQELSLLPDLSVGENLLMGQLPARRGITRPGGAAHAGARRCSSASASTGSTRTRRSRRCRSPPSSSSRSRRCSARTPRVLIFDEPTTALSESRDEGAARPDPRAARRGPRRDVRDPPPRGDVRDRRPRHGPARRRARHEPADERLRPGLADRVDGRAQDRVAVPGVEPHDRRAAPEGPRAEARGRGGADRLRGPRRRDRRHRRPARLRPQRAAARDLRRRPGRGAATSRSTASGCARATRAAPCRPGSAC